MLHSCLPVHTVHTFPHLPTHATGGESGSADTVRDPRGFAVKFYTEDGNWDLVGNNTPIFFIRDPTLVRECMSGHGRVRWEGEVGG